jgi:acetyl esterase/lipase
VLTLRYRLAPEHPFPEGLEDVLTAYRWLIGSGVDPQSVVVGGDSAGGGLAIAALVALRDAGDALPAGGLGLCSWTDLAMTGSSIRTLADRDEVVELEGLERTAQLYLAGEDPGNPLASPLYADHTGLPPLFLQVGTAEILLDDSRRLAERAREAGVRVILDEWPDMPHVFQTLAPLITEAGKALHQAGVFVRRVTAR